jgi:hypothetical protein
MKAVLESLKPYFYYLVGEGIKGVEVRKTSPKAEDWNKDTFCYMSRDEKSFAKIPKEFQEKYRKHFGKVGLRFVCDRIDEFSVPYPAYFSEIDSKTDSIIKAACLKPMEIHAYNGVHQTYGWHITDLVVYDEPRELRDFQLPCDHENDCGTCKRAIYCSSTRRFCRCDLEDGLKRPPQSWCYVKEVE